MTDSLASEPSRTNSPADIGELNRDQYFSVRRTPAGFVTSGDASAFIGHCLRGADPHRPDGAWVRWEWNGAELSISNDRYGLIPVYFVLGDDSFALSTSIPRLLEEGAPRDLDEDALSVFLRAGVFLGDDTPFRAIRALPPGVSHVWRGDRVAPQGTMPQGTPVSDLSRADALHRFGQLMQDAVARRARLFPAFGVPLSGGMDSRHILLELCRLGQKPRLTFTARAYRGMPSRDVDIAQTISATVGVPHIVLDHPVDWLSLETRRGAWTNYCTLEHDWSLLAVDDGLGKDLGACFDGIGGDVFTDCRSITTESRLAAFREGRFRDLAAEFLGDTVAPRRYLAPGLRRQLTWERAMARTTAEFVRFASAPNPPAAFWFWNRTRRTVALAPFGIWQRAFHVLAPYMDESVFDFMAGLPVEWVKDYGFHADVINQEFETLAGTPFFSEANATPPKGWPGYRQMAAQAVRQTLGASAQDVLARGYVLSRLGRAVLDPGYGRSASWLPAIVAYLTEVGRLRSA